MHSKYLHGYSCRTRIIRLSVCLRSRMPVKSNPPTHRSRIGLASCKCLSSFMAAGGVERCENRISEATNGENCLVLCSELARAA